MQVYHGGAWIRSSIGSVSPVMIAISLPLDSCKVHMPSRFQVSGVGASVAQLASVITEQSSDKRRSVILESFFASCQQ